MEGVGSRLGRASSRYGATTVFNGPVRKWKKKWVHVSSSSGSSTVSGYRSSSSQPQGSRLLLCRWTPISSSAADSNSAAPEEPPKRKFRYTPIAVLEEQKKSVAKRADEEGKASEADQSIARSTSKSNEVVKEETKDGNTSPLDASQAGSKDSAVPMKTKTTAPFQPVN